MNRVSGAILSVAICLLWCASGLAEVRVEFPLGDYYRPGRYVPVRIIATIEESPSRAEARITADGTVPTILPLRDGHADALVPWLVLRTPLGAVSAGVSPDRPPTDHPSPRRPLATNERLVGHTIDALHVIARHLPEQDVLPIRLDAANPLPGQPAAWEALDVLLLDRPSYQRLRADAVPVLLSAGTMLIVASAEAPDDRWPWVRFDDHWLLRLDIAGLSVATFDDRHYEPAHAWRAEWPRRFRLQVLLLAVLMGCVAGMAALWRSRFAPAAVVIVVGLSMIGLAGWRSMHQPVPHVRGDVLVQHGPIAQRDAWHYQASIQPADAAFAWHGLSRPMPAGQWHLNQTQLMLRCRSDGEPFAFVYHLPRGMRIGFLTRELEPAIEFDDPRLPITSPLARTVRSIYMAPGDGLIGEIDEPEQAWPTILLHRR